MNGAGRIAVATVPPEWDSMDRRLQTYGLKVVQWAPLSAVMARVFSSQRVFTAHQCAAQAAAWRCAASDWVAQHGFLRAERPLMTLYGERYVPTADGWVFYLTDGWLADAPVDGAVTASQLGVTLATLHDALRGFRLADSLAASTTSERYGQWQAALVRASAVLRHRLQPLSRAVVSADAPSWLVDDVVRLADACVRQLDAADYNTVAAGAACERLTAWNGAYRDSFQRRPDGRWTVLQSRDPVADDPLYDLATLCHDFLQLSDWQAADAALAAYCAVHPLTTNAQLCVRAYASFPHRWLTVQVLDTEATDVQQRQQQIAAKHRFLAPVSTV